MGWPDFFFPEAGEINSGGLGKLIGKLGFPQANLFGKFARTQMRPLYRKFYARSYVSSLSSNGRAIFIWWKDLLLSLHPRIPRSSLAKTDFVVYTDAALLSRRIAGLILISTPRGPVVTLLVEAATPHFWLSKFNRKNPIIGLEMIAPIALIHTDPQIFRGKRVNFILTMTQLLID